MLRAKDILTRNGEPILVELTEVAENRRFPAWQYGFKIELPDAIKEEMRSQIRESAMRAGRSLGLDEDEVEEHIREHVDHAVVECLADEPFPICWN